MKNYDELIESLRSTESWSDAADAIQELQAERDGLIDRIDDLTSEEHSIPELRQQLHDSFLEKQRCYFAVSQYQTANDNLRAERDELNQDYSAKCAELDIVSKAADDAAAAHKVERDELEKSLKDASVAAIAEALEVDNLRHELSVLKEKHCYTKADLEQQEPVAWLKTWNSVGNAQEGMRRVDLTPESELWLANMFPKVTPLFLAAGAAPQGEQQ
jgi:cell division protein FtsB